MLSKYGSVVCLLSLGLFLTVCPLFAQGYLQKSISLSLKEQSTVRTVLDQIAKDQNFYFSYQSNLINLEAHSNLPNEVNKVKLESLLLAMFGSAYEFKELPGYVIIRYAPGKLDLDAAINTGRNHLSIKGKVSDLQTNKGVSFASVYEKNGFVSTLTDHEGNFELKVKQATHPAVWLTLSREDYRDTTFVILPEIEVSLSNNRRMLRFIPEDESAIQALENSYFGRMFISFRQRMQRINLGGVFAESPIQMSLTPGLSSQGMSSSQMINHFSLNLLGGYTAGVEGAEVAGLFNINQRDVMGFQTAGIFNAAGGSVQGFQSSGISNMVYKDVKGFQVGGIYNRVKQNVDGFQVAGLINHTDSLAQAQVAGLYNLTGKSEVLQISGLGNVSKSDANGIQLSGLYNQTYGRSRHQVSGLINRTKVAKGIQFSGVLNIADSSDYSIGIVNLIKNGKKRLSLSTDEFSHLQLTFRSGGRKTYGVVGMAYAPWFTETKFAPELGYGIHLIDKKIYTMDLEWVNKLVTDFAGNYDHISSFRWLHGILIHDHLSILVGPSMNFSIVDHAPNKRIPGYLLAERHTQDTNYGLHLGMLIGVQYQF
ncbi:carboxypeptidase-like regulatory domain-containing protein [Belliella sp. DSM 111904]|uniref:Carboxypeptidase-like regulatory domain-containing protein n=1 Tax=Belliella filtrata TaxID=2923435 RepID=A0ABS9UXU1_9BACT|nr:carboxypeptidase-like regulatory domain-containing protein [Belliella filtrata]MCH7408934.1 carboxypeptidase-like regulatory domain-containing protein [Belliella filtrata]